jgi:hypothetical protein
LLSGATVHQSPPARHPHRHAKNHGGIESDRCSRANFSTLSFERSGPPTEPLITVKQTKGAQVTGESSDVTYCHLWRAKDRSVFGQHPRRQKGRSEASSPLTAACWSRSATASRVKPAPSLPSSATQPVISHLLHSKFGAGGITAKNNVALLAGLSTAPHVATQTGTPNSDFPKASRLRSFSRSRVTAHFPSFLAQLQGTGISASNNTALCSVLGDGTIRVLVQKAHAHRT